MSIRPASIALLAVTLTLAGAGCANPDAPARQTPAGQTQNPGEPPAPAPPTARSQAPTDVQDTPAQALAAFAATYVNWDYRTLTHRQRTLASISIGPARLAEQQAAATSAADSTIQQAQIHNSGQLASLAPDRARPGLWVIVTREQTSGASQYEGLPASYHVTLARLGRVPGGWAVSEWLPQN